MAINLNNNNQNGNNGINGNPEEDENTPKATGTGYTNINQVLNANKNNGLGNAVQSGVQNITNQAQQQTQQDQTQFNNSLGNAVQDIKNGQQVQQQLQGIDFGNNAQGSENQIQTIGGDQYAQSLADLRNGYQGQQGLTDATALQGQAQNLQQLGQTLGSSGGRQAALQQFVNAGPNYTANKQQLDSVLLGQNPDVINQARRNALMTAANTNQAVNQAANEGQNLSQEFNSTYTPIQNELNAAGTNLGTTLTNTAAADTSQANTDLANLNNAINTKTANGTDVSYLQSILGNNGNLYNFTPGQLATLNNANVYTQSGVANQNEYNAAQALARLAGGNLSTLPTLNANQIGTQQVGNLNNELSVNQPTLTAYNTQAKAAQGNINAANNTLNQAQTAATTAQTNLNNYLNANPGMAGANPFNANPNYIPYNNTVTADNNALAQANQTLAAAQTNDNTVNGTNGWNNTLQSELMPSPVAMGSNNGTSLTTGGKALSPRQKALQNLANGTT